MQVRTGRGAGRADIADHVALFHLLAGLYALGIAGEVGVGGLVAAGMLDLDVVAVAAITAGALDRAVTGRIDRCAGGRRKVGALVQFCIARNRMLALAKTGGDPGAVDRRLHQELRRALAILVIIIGDVVIRRGEVVEAALQRLSVQGRVERFAIAHGVPALVVERLEQDLEPLFMDKNYIRNWLKNWRESYLRLLDEYKIHTVTALREILVKEDFSTDNFSFTYMYDTMEKDIVKVVYTVTYEWIKFQKPLGVDTREDLMGLVRVESGTELNDQIKQFLALFFTKNASYFKKVNNIMLGDAITTKVIRTTADNLNQKEQVVLNKSALLSCELDDLLK